MEKFLFPDQILSLTLDLYTLNCPPTYFISKDLMLTLSAMRKSRMYTCKL